MHAVDIMTSPVVSVKPETTITEVAKLMAERHISALPVVDEKSHVVGMISEGDLLRRAEIGTGRRASWWLDLLVSNDELADDYIKSRSRTVGDVMTKNVVTASEHASLFDIAGLLEAHQIKRVPVTRDGKLVGIVSRANLVQALASVAAAAPPTHLSDRAIRDRLMAELKRQPWADPTPGNILVHDGIVHFWGYVLSDTQRRALHVAAENVPGVKSVVDHTGRSVILPTI